VQGDRPVSIEPAVSADGKRRGEAFGSGDAHVGATISEVRLSFHLGEATAARLADQPQASLSTVAS